MTYDYIRKAYSLDYAPGQRVTHTVTEKAGQVTTENRSQGHYVQVRFDDRNYSVPCHPQELVIHVPATV